MNYQLVLDETIKKLDYVPKLLLHVCCAPCSSYVLEYLSNYLELNRFDVYTFTLPGHERTLFKHVTKEEWIDSCESHLQMLIKRGYKKIYVMGHSMGGVLATILADRHKEVKKLVLAAPAFKYMTFDELLFFKIMNIIGFII